MTTRRKLLSLLWDRDDIVLNYKDLCCIYGRDLDLLVRIYDTTTDDDDDDDDDDTTGTGTFSTTTNFLERQIQLAPVPSSSWLNDTIIHYQLLRLDEKYQVSTATTITGSKVLLLDPIVASYFLQQLDIDDTGDTDDDDDDAVDECVAFWKTFDGFRNTHRLLIPINDAMMMMMMTRMNVDNATVPSTTNDGTHWSLLAIDLQKRAVTSIHKLSDYSTYTTTTTTNNNNNDDEYEDSSTTGVVGTFFPWIVHGYHMDSLYSCGGGGGGVRRHGHEQQQPQQQPSGNAIPAQYMTNKMQRYITKMQQYHCKQPNSTRTTETTITTNVGVTTDAATSPTNTPAIATNTRHIHTVNVPQQRNGSDCGIHVLVNFETILMDPYNFHYFTCYQSYTTSNDSNNSNRNRVSSCGSSTGSESSDNKNYFHRQQMDRFHNEPNFSISERRNIGRDIIIITRNATATATNTTTTTGTIPPTATQC